PTLLAATAGGRTGRGTRPGTIACQAGAVSAATTPSRKVKNSRTGGLTRASDTSAAIAVETHIAALTTASSSRRVSRMSASAPAGSANRNIGTLVATWTRETTRGSGVSVVISQPAAALYIQVPMFATTVAIHRTENVACRNGLHGDAACGTAAGGVLVSG